MQVSLSLFRLVKDYDNFGHPIISNLKYPDILFCIASLVSIQQITAERTENLVEGGWYNDFSN